MIFGDITATPLEMGNWLNSGIGVLCCILIVVSIWDKLKSKPPVENQIKDLAEKSHALFATKEDLRNLNLRMDRFESEMYELKDTFSEKIDQLKDSLNAAGEARVVALHNRINELLIMMKGGRR